MTRSRKPEKSAADAIPTPCDEAGEEPVAGKIMDLAGDSEPAESNNESDNETAPQDPLEAAIAERDLHKDNWLRAQAELDNFRKRTLKETQQNRRYQSLQLARDLLPGIDNLERAIAAAENSSSLDELMQGVRMVAQQFQEILARHEIRPIEAAGRAFDPNLHEAIHQRDSADHAPMTVLEEVERGYQLHDRVIRPSKVIVSTAPSNPAEEE